MLSKSSVLLWVCLLLCLPGVLCVGGCSWDDQQAKQAVDDAAGVVQRVAAEKDNFTQLLEQTQAELADAKTRLAQYELTPEELAEAQAIFDKTEEEADRLRAQVTSKDTELAIVTAEFEKLKQRAEDGLGFGEALESGGSMAQSLAPLSGPAAPWVLLAGSIATALGREVQSRNKAKAKHEQAAMSQHAADEYKKQAELADQAASDTLAKLSTVVRSIEAVKQAGGGFVDFNAEKTKATLRAVQGEDTAMVDVLRASTKKPETQEVAA